MSLLGTHEGWKRNLFGRRSISLSLLCPTSRMLGWLKTLEIDHLWLCEEIWWNWVGVIEKCVYVTTWLVVMLSLITFRIDFKMSKFSIDTLIHSSAIFYTGFRISFLHSRDVMLYAWVCGSMGPIYISSLGC